MADGSSGHDGDSEETESLVENIFDKPLVGFGLFWVAVGELPADDSGGICE